MSKTAAVGHIPRPTRLRLCRHSVALRADQDGVGSSVGPHQMAVKGWPFDDLKRRTYHSWEMYRILEGSWRTVSRLSMDFIESEHGFRVTQCDALPGACVPR
jgi:hypothetical protein